MELRKWGNGVRLNQVIHGRSKAKKLVKETLGILEARKEKVKISRAEVRKYSFKDEDQTSGGRKGVKSKQKRVQENEGQEYGVKKGKEIEPETVEGGKEVDPKGEISMTKTRESIQARKEKVKILKAEVRKYSFEEEDQTSGGRKGVKSKQKRVQENEGQKDELRRGKRQSQERLKEVDPRSGISMRKHSNKEGGVIRSSNRSKFRRRHNERASKWERLSKGI
ncbi:hypothetical protein CCACVL1_08110 [Corchorus capsularis]|uniref:Uncharacterized protein n=1 Tax=Corchorus capsularis TaxID=210143 RepID=A0A1R3J256_COCAP|nr:hypothetical protein CCACVL1_08110 [Corchorus capsularis]